MPIEFNVNELELIKIGEDGLYSAFLDSFEPSGEWLMMMSNLYRALFLSIEGCDFNGHVKDNHAFVSCIMNCHHDMNLGAMTLLRGHGSDSSLFTRRAIEYAAFGSLLLKAFVDDISIRDNSTPHALTEIFLQSGDSNKKFERYRAKFSVVQSVKQSAPVFGDWFIQQYHDLSKEVHASYISMAERMTCGETFHRSSYFEDNSAEKSIRRLLHLVDVHMVINQGFANQLRALPKFSYQPLEQLLELASRRLDVFKHRFKTGGNKRKAKVEV